MHVGVGSDAPDFHRSSLGSTSSIPAESGLPGEAGGPRVSPGASPGDSTDDSQVRKEEHPPRGIIPSGEARPEPYGTTPQVFWDSFRLLPHPRRLDRHRQVSVRFPTRQPDGATRTFRRGAVRQSGMGRLPKLVLLRTEDRSLKRGITGDASPPRSCLEREAVLLSTLPQCYTCTARDSNPGPLASDASALTIRPTRAALPHKPF